MYRIKHQKENRIVKYFVILLLVVWASFMFLSMQLVIRMLFNDLYIFSKFGSWGIISYLPFLLFGLLFLTPFYLLFKGIYNTVAHIKFFKSDKINLFFSFILYYGMPLFFATIISNRILKIYRILESCQTQYQYPSIVVKFITIVLPLIIILLLDYIYSKISKNFKKFKKVN